jgi:hypothetical protein
VVLLLHKIYLSLRLRQSSLNVVDPSLPSPHGNTRLSRSLMERHAQLSSAVPQLSDLALVSFDSGFEFRSVFDVRALDGFDHIVDGNRVGGAQFAGFRLAADLDEDGGDVVCDGLEELRFLGGGEVSQVGEAEGGVAGAKSEVARHVVLVVAGLRM